MSKQTDTDVTDEIIGVCDNVMSLEAACSLLTATMLGVVRQIASNAKMVNMATLHGFDFDRLTLVI